MVTYKNLDLEKIKWLAQKLAAKLTRRPVKIGLIGPLGAGKTTFIQAFAGKLGIKKISSPTFVLTHEHQTKRHQVYHIDFYRLHKRTDLNHLGLDEIMTGRNIVLIEWVNKFPTVAKQCDLLINFKIKKNNKRDVTIRSKK